MIKIPDFLKKAGEQIAVEAGLEITRGFLNDKIKNVAPGDLYNSIRENQDLWSVTPDEMRGGGLKLKQRFGKYLEKYKDEITVEVVLKWMEKDHNDLYSTILNTPNGLVYMSNQVEKIKQKILTEL